MSEERKNMEFEYKDEYWLEAKKLLEKEEKKRRFFFWFTGICCASIAAALFFTNFNNNDIVTQNTSTPLETISHSNINQRKENNNNFENNIVNPKKELENSSDAATIKRNYTKNETINNNQLILDNTLTPNYPISIHSVSLQKIEIDHKINLSNIENPLLGKSIDSTKKIKNIKGNFLLIAGAQMHQSFLQESLSKSNFVGWKVGVTYQKFVKENVFFSFGLAFNTYSNLMKKDNSDIRNDEIQNLNLVPATVNSNNSSNGSGVVISNVEIKNNTYNIAGTVYNATDVVARKEQTSKEYIYAGSVALPISFGVKVQRFNLHCGFTGEYILYNKINEKNNLFINSTQLTKSENAIYNDFSETPRWLNFATVGADYNLNKHFKIGVEAKKMIHNKYKNTLQSCVMVKYSF